MTAPSIVSDTEAREIARRLKPEPSTALGLFVATGEIHGFLADLARSGMPSVFDERLLVYVAYHGERGPVEAGYRVTVTAGGRVLPGDVWELALGDGEVVVREIKTYFDGPDRAVFDDGTSAVVSAMVSRDSWTLKSRKPVSRQEVATLDEAREAAAGWIEGKWGVVDDGHQEYDREAAVAYVEACNIGEDGGSVEVNGSSITVEKTEGWAGL